MYYGRAQLADDYFDMLGYKLPYRVNVADFILDLASGDVSTSDRSGSHLPFYLISGVPFANFLCHIPFAAGVVDKMVWYALPAAAAASFNTRNKDIWSSVVSFLYLV